MYWHKIIQKNKIPSDLGELHFQSVSSKLPLKSVGESIILRTIHNRTNATEIAQILSSLLYIRPFWLYNATFWKTYVISQHFCTLPGWPA